MKSLLRVEQTLLVIKFYLVIVDALAQRKKKKGVLNLSDATENRSHCFLEILSLNAKAIHGWEAQTSKSVVLSGWEEWCYSD